MTNGKPDELLIPLFCEKCGVLVGSSDGTSVIRWVLCEKCIQRSSEKEAQ